MSDLIGPNTCPECGGEYGEHDSKICSKSPENLYHGMPVYLCDNGLVVHLWGKDKYVIRRYAPNDPVDGPSWDIFLNGKWGSRSVLLFDISEYAFDSLEAAVRTANTLQ